jgi:hypothetical protein
MVSKNYASSLAFTGRPPMLSQPSKRSNTHAQGLLLPTHHMPLGDGAEKTKPDPVQVAVEPVAEESCEISVGMP